jgi:hypothetical protein
MSTSVTAGSARNDHMKNPNNNTRAPLTCPERRVRDYQTSATSPTLWTISGIVPFDLDAIKGAVDTLLDHGAKGRIVIAFE